MATTADSSSPYSPRFRRSSPVLSSPWSHVVRGEHDHAPAKPLTEPSGEPADDALTVGAEQVGAAPPPEKRSAWNRPSNGVAEASMVMGATSWPALSEAAKAPTRSSSHDSLKDLSNAPISAPSAPMPASPPPKSDPISAGSSSSADQVALMNQKSMKRSGGSISDSAINGKSVVTSGHGVSEPHEALDKSLNSEPSSRQLAGRSNNWDHGSAAGGLSPRSHRGTEHHKNYGGTGSRRGLHQSNFGNRSDSHDWNHRTFSGGRDVQPQQQQHHRQRATSRPFYRPPPPAVAPFVASPSSVRPFASPAGYHDIPSPIFYVPPPPPPEAFRGIPFVSPPPMYLASPDLQLRTLLIKQIDYYFSPENLCKDVYLRQNMDQEGWVPLSLIAGFNRVRNLTNNLQLILDTVKTSTIVEVQGDKIRRRLDWKNWPPLSSAPKSPDSFALSGHDALTTRLSGIKIEGNMGQNSTRVAASSVGIPGAGDFGSQTQAAVSAENKSAQHGQNSFDGRISARSLSRSDTF